MIRVKNANKRYTSEIVVAAALGMLDKVYGIPLELITLRWTRRKRNYHQAKTKGFEDVFITRPVSGGRIEVEYRQPGSAEWLKSGLTGEFTAQVAKTPWNMGVLCGMYYDKLWTIVDDVANEEVKKLADDLDNHMKTVKVHKWGMVAEATTDAAGNATKVMVNKVVGEETLYDYHKRRREAQFKTVHGDELAGYTETGADADQMRMEMARREMELKNAAQKLTAERLTFKKIQEEYFRKGGKSAAQSYSEEALRKMNYKKLQGLAKNEFNIADAFTMRKEPLVEMIMELQERKRPADVDTPKEEEVVTG
jgi:hypothetical protein